MHRLSLFLNNIVVSGYFLSIRIAAPFNAKAKKWVRGRRSWRNSLPPEKSPGEKRVWVHCASLGEFEQARTVIEGLKCNNQAPKVILTFFSSSGYEIRKNYDGADYVLYLPADTARNAEWFVNRVNPDVAVFAKYEFWYHILAALHAQKIPVVLIAAVFRQDQVFFRWYGALFREMLRNYECIFVQDTVSAELLASINITRVQVAPDTRVDRVFQLNRSAPELPLAATFRNGHKVIIAGSTYPEEEEMLLRFAEEAPPGLKFVIAPHEVHPKRINALLRILPSAVQYTEANTGSLPGKRFLVVDTVGLLSALYRCGDVAVVGGGFRKTVHNVLEPAAYGLPVLFGPRYHRFSEAVELISVGGAFSFTRYGEFRDKLNALLDNADTLTRASEICSNYIRNNTGGTEIVLSYLQRLL